MYCCIIIMITYPWMVSPAPNNQPQQCKLRDEGVIKTISVCNDWNERLLSMSSWPLRIPCKRPLTYEPTDMFDLISSSMRTARSRPLFVEIRDTHTHTQYNQVCDSVAGGIPSTVLYCMDHPRYCDEVFQKRFERNLHNYFLCLLKMQKKLCFSLPAKKPQWQYFCTIKFKWWWGHKQSIMGGTWINAPVANPEK